MPLFRKAKLPMDESLESLAESAQRLALMNELEQRLNLLSTLDFPYLWLDTYDALPEKLYAEVSWDFGNMVQDILWLRPVLLDIPEEIRLKIPPNAKADVVRAYREHALFEFASNLRTALDSWESQRTFQINLDDPWRADVVIQLMSLTLLKIRLLDCDFRATVTYWNDRIDISRQHQSNAHRWDELISAPQQRLREVVEQMRERFPLELEAMGFTEEMWARLLRGCANREVVTVSE